MTPFEEVMAVRGKGMPADGEVLITGADPVFSTKVKIGETCAALACVNRSKAVFGYGCE